MIQNGPVHLDFSSPENKCNLELYKSTKSPTTKSHFSIFWLSYFFIFFCRGMNFHMSSSETHQAHLTHSTSASLLHSNPSSVSSLPTWPYALTRLASDKSSHIHVGVKTYLWESYMLLVGLNSIIKPP